MSPAYPAWNEAYSGRERRTSSTTRSMLASAGAIFARSPPGMGERAMTRMAVPSLRS